MTPDKASRRFCQGLGRHSLSNLLKFCLASLLLLLFLVQSTCPLSAQGSRSFAIRYKQLQKQRYLYLSDVARFYGMNYSQAGKNAVLQSRYSYLLFSKDSRIFRINGIESNLSFAIAEHEGEILLPQVDFQSFIDPILRRSIVPKRKISHIMLDPGHGGKDPGAQNQGIVEKNLNLLFSRRIAAILRKRGYKVSMTRNQDRLLSLEQRSAAAKRLQPDLYISIHCNASANAAVNGIETYVINPAQTPSSGGNTFATKAAAGNAYDHENALLGFIMHSALLKASNANDRGLKRKQFYVIREVACPAALLELGFLSNADERKKLLESYYQDKLSVAVCDAIQEYEKALKPEQ